MELILVIIAFLLLVLNVWIFSIVDAIEKIKEKETDEEIEKTDIELQQHKKNKTKQLEQQIQKLEMELSRYHSRDKVVEEMEDFYKTFHKFKNYFLK